jgi:outer membrane lipoprotein-sorting protein
MIKKLSHLANLFLICCIPAPVAMALDAEALVLDSFNYMRGKASVATVEMVIHRPDWERRMTIKAWTKGEKESLFFITAPPKDNGNGTLKKGREMWIFNPKVNRVIKLPPSMMSQAWMGSDFSNNDIAKSDSLIYDYRHQLIKTATDSGKKVYYIESLPKPDAPVVWGMLKLKIREDLILLSETFYDEDLKPVKIMTTLEIKPLGGKLYPKIWKMQKADTENEYTLLHYKALSFKPSLPNRLFSIPNLKNPRR